MDGGFHCNTTWSCAHWPLQAPSQPSSLPPSISPSPDAPPSPGQVRYLSFLYWGFNILTKIQFRWDQCWPLRMLLARACQTLSARSPDQPKLYLLARCAQSPPLRSLPNHTHIYAPSMCLTLTHPSIV